LKNKQNVLTAAAAASSRSDDEDREDSDSEELMVVARRFSPDDPLPFEDAPKFQGKRIREEKTVVENESKRRLTGDKKLARQVFNHVLRIL
jgi:hypothetical protein